MKTCIGTTINGQKVEIYPSMAGGFTAIIGRKTLRMSRSATIEYIWTLGKLNDDWSYNFLANLLGKHDFSNY